MLIGVFHFLGRDTNAISPVGFQVDLIIMSLQYLHNVDMSLAMCIPASCISILLDKKCLCMISAYRDRVECPYMSNPHLHQIMLLASPKLSCYVQPRHHYSPNNLLTRFNTLSFSGS